MMRHEETVVFETYMYTPALEILVSWGRNHIFRPGETETLQKLEEELIFPGQGEELGEPLTEGLGSLEQNVYKSLDFLHGKDALNLQGEKTLVARTALEALDYVVFLVEALDHFPSREVFSDDFRQRALKLFALATMDKTPSGLRLTRMNRWRKEVRKHIPKDKLFMFPWYNNCTDLPPNTIDILIEKYDEMKNGLFGGMKVNPGMMEELIGSLPVDPGLLRYIHKEANLLGLFSNSVKKSLCLRLLVLGDRGTAGHITPPKVEDKGIIPCACKVVDIAKNPLKSEEDRLERLFLSGFCGPDLDIAHRVAIYTRLENSIHMIDRSNVETWGPLDSLVKWSEDEISDNMLLKNVFDNWSKRLEEAAKEMETIPAAPSFSDAVRRLQHGTLNNKEESL